MNKASGGTAGPHEPSSIYTLTSQAVRAYYADLANDFSSPGLLEPGLTHTSEASRHHVYNRYGADRTTSSPRVNAAEAIFDGHAHEHPVSVEDQTRTSENRWLSEDALQPFGAVNAIEHVKRYDVVDKESWAERAMYYLSPLIARPPGGECLPLRITDIVGTNESLYRCCACGSEDLLKRTNNSPKSYACSFECGWCIKDVYGMRLVDIPRPCFGCPVPHIDGSRRGTSEEMWGRCHNWGRYPLSEEEEQKREDVRDVKLEYIRERDCLAEASSDSEEDRVSGDTPRTIDPLELPEPERAESEAPSSVPSQFKAASLAGWRLTAESILFETPTSKLMSSAYPLYPLWR